MFNFIIYATYCYFSLFIVLLLFHNSKRNQFHMRHSLIWHGNTYIVFFARCLACSSAAGVMMLCRWLLLTRNTWAPELTRIKSAELDPCLGCSISAKSCGNKHHDSILCKSLYIDCVCIVLGDVMSLACEY